MNLVDSCGWLEYIADGPNASCFAVAIEDHDTLIVPAICIYEVYKVLQRSSGEHSALRAAAIMSKGALVPIDESIALSAAKISNDYGLPMADSIIIASAHQSQATIWTQDVHFAKLPGVKYFPTKKSK
jgi:predicted nucleic acid-binding protein